MAACLVYCVIWCCGSISCVLLFWCCGSISCVLCENVLWQDVLCILCVGVVVA